MAYNTSLANAVAMASTVTGTDTHANAKPTKTDLETVWAQIAVDIEAQLGGCGIAIATSPSSKALTWAQRVETLFVSGEALRNRGAIGADGEANGPDLIESAEKKLAWACTEHGKAWLLANGATAATTSGGSGIPASHWTDDLGGYPSGYEDPDNVHPREIEDGVQW